MTSVNSNLSTDNQLAAPPPPAKAAPADSSSTDGPAAGYVGVAVHQFVLDELSKGTPKSELLKELQRRVKKVMGVELSDEEAEAHYNSAAKTITPIEECAHKLRAQQVTPRELRRELLSKGFPEYRIADYAKVPEIVLKESNLVENTIACERVLNQLGVYYRRGDELVKPVLAKDADNLSLGSVRHPESVVIQPANVTSVQFALGHNGLFTKFIRSGKDFKGVPAKPTRELAEHILERVCSMPADVPYPVLDMAVNTPVLLPDGTVLTGGYKNGVLVMSNREYPPVPEHPTKEDAVAALKKFDPIFCKFPFKRTDEHQEWNDTPSYSCVLAGALSLVARPALPTVPLFGVSAPTRGTGKTKIIEATGSAMLGYRPTAVAYPNAEEFQKLLLPLLRGQDRIVLIDNVSMPLKGDKLNAILTATSFRDRILGQSKDIQLFNRAVFFASGNNLQIEGDLGRRTLQITVDANVERPEERRFDFDPVRLAASLHPQLVTAALTAVRAYILVGRPDVLDRALLGSFEQWDRLICGTLVWCGYADPTLTRTDVAENDPEYDFALSILESWDEACGRDTVSIAEIGKADGESASQIRLAQLLGRNGEFNPRSAGKLINRLVNRPIGGWKLVKAGYRQYQLLDNRP